MKMTLKIIVAAAALSAASFGAFAQTTGAYQSNDSVQPSSYSVPTQKSDSPRHGFFHRHEQPVSALSDAAPRGETGDKTFDNTYFGH